MRLFFNFVLVSINVMIPDGFPVEHLWIKFESAFRVHPRIQYNYIYKYY